MIYLNKEQELAFNYVKEGHSLFLTGIPGAGKSYTLKYIIDYLKSINTNIAITASTGCAAVLINGQTINSYLNMGIGNRTVQYIVNDLMKKKEYICKLQTLIIDEISMIDDTTLDNISDILSKIKKNKKPFGGVQMILVGDFCQLAPVKGNYCFLSNSWRNLNPLCVQLLHSIRQKDDEEFQHILKEIRFGKCSNITFKKLSQLEHTKFDNLEPTKLYSLNCNVDTINMNEFNNLYEKSFKKPVAEAKIVNCHPYSSEMDFIFEHFDALSIDDSTIRCYNISTNSKNIKKEDYQINLYKGLRVMITRNINFEKQIINGTQGIISSLTNNYVCIDVNGEKHNIYYHKDTNENSDTFVKFIPIKLAYALSIHKSQGTTLDAIDVDGSSYIFAPGQLYTALSRAKNLQSICLHNLDKTSFICNPEVRRFYEKCCV